MSSCVPILFKPMQINGVFHVDGAMTMHTPECYDPEETLAIFNEYKKTVPVNNLTNYITRLLQTSIDIQAEDYKKKCLLSIPCRIPDDLAEHGSIDRTHNESKAKRFFQVGFSCALQCMDSNFRLTMDMILLLALRSFVDFYQSNENDDNSY